MKALTVTPLRKDSGRLEDVGDPPREAGALLVDTLAVGICGTDIDILKGLYGFAMPGKDRLILGHEALGRVREAPAGSGFKVGDTVVPIVRRPDPEPCFNCARGEWDMCRNGKYTEHGIKELDGFLAERFRVDPEFAVPVDGALGDLGVLVEPTSVVAKAWEQIGRIGQRSAWAPARVLVTGAGPIGLLAALLGVQRKLEVHVLDLVDSGPKPELVRALGATYHAGDVGDLCGRADIVLECTGVPEVIWRAIKCAAPDGIVCLAGVSSGGRKIPLDLGEMNRELVLENNVVFGSVNANRGHYELAAKALAEADKEWLGRIITRRVPIARWHEAVERGPTDIKPIIVFGG